MHSTARVVACLNSDSCSHDAMLRTDLRSSDEKYSDIGVALVRVHVPEPGPISLSLAGMLAVIALRRRSNV